MACHESTRVLEHCRISPWPASATEAGPLPLTFFDLLWLRRDDLVERLFLYPFPHTSPATTATFTESYLPSLKSALSLTLRHFYPLAGRVRPTPGSSHRYELHYTEGDSVLLTVAETDLDLLDLAGSHARESYKFRPLVPPLPPEHPSDGGGGGGVGRPLLAVQVTVFPHRGIGVGITIHHVACDGAGFTHFVKSWASSSKSGGHFPLVVGDAPSFDRSVIADPCNLYALFLGDGNTASAPPAAFAAAPLGQLVRATFTLGPDHIQGLKATAAVGKKDGHSSSFHCSTFVVTCAFMWACIAKARGISSCRADTKAHFGFMADWRKRLQPPVPDAYFGNCVEMCPVEVEVGDLVQGDGVAVAAEAIGRVIQGLTRGVSECLAGFREKFLTVVASGCPVLGAISSPKFKVYDVDFGWGRPLKVEVVSLGAGAICLSDSGEVRGGVEVGVVLPKHEMEALATQF
uniref:Malonyltransferase n=1 Tax=Iris hollandica TaxID=35876 RepID=A0A059XCW0_IRIHO|nr:malonyltransferase [Iris x hollandica]